nr:unnamed protein product [Digitaria exilis]
MGGGGGGGCAQLVAVEQLVGELASGEGGGEKLPLASFFIGRQAVELETRGGEARASGGAEERASLVRTSPSQHSRRVRAACGGGWVDEAARPVPKPERSI